MSGWILGTVLFFILSLLIGQGTAQSKPRWSMEKSVKWPGQYGIGWRPPFTAILDEPIDVCMENEEGSQWKLTIDDRVGSKDPPRQENGATCFEARFTSKGKTVLVATLRSTSSGKVMQTSIRSMLVKEQTNTTMAYLVKKDYDISSVDTDHLIKDTTDVQAMVGDKIRIIVQHYKNPSGWEMTLEDGLIQESEWAKDVADPRWDINTVDYIDVLAIETGDYIINLDQKFTVPVNATTLPDAERVDGHSIKIFLEVFGGSTPTDE